MKKGILLIVFVGFYLISFSQLQYISPKPDSKYNNPETSIILTHNIRFKPQIIDKNVFSITGSVSGNHVFEVLIVENNKTIILKPSKPFAEGEFVHIYLNNNLLLENNTVIEPFSYKFQISQHSKIQTNTTNSELQSNVSFSGTYPNFPSLTINTNDNPAEGKVFFHNISALESDNDRYIAIIENDGTPFYTKQDNKRGLGFTLQKNGHLTYWNNKSFYMLDSSYAVADSFACGNGYEADWHEFQLLNNGHAFLISWDLQIIDMSLIVTGGQEFATVEGLIIQELNENKEVIFQWRSWDHFEITDAVDVDFTTSYVSYNHGNALEIDSDTTLLISSRLMNEITKINRNTGEIIWRLGGKHNEFAFIDDSGFCRQHDIRRLENGNITLFDNGGCHVPQVSAAKEYELDEINKTAKLVWKFEHPTKMYCETMGNVQRLSNGNTFINWGRLPDSGMTGENLLPAITEVRPDKSIAYELTFNTFFHMVYRSYRFDWNVIPTNIDKDEIDTKPFDFSIYPNPANNYFNLTITLENPELINISLFNSTGAIVKQIIDYKAQKGENNLKIITNSLNYGLYLCSITCKDFTLSKKIVITH